MDGPLQRPLRGVQGRSRVVDSIWIFVVNCMGGRGGVRFWRSCMGGRGGVSFTLFAAHHAHTS